MQIAITSTYIVRLLSPLKLTYSVGVVVTPPTEAVITSLSIIDDVLGSDDKHSSTHFLFAFVTIYTALSLLSVNISNKLLILLPFFVFPI